MKALILAGPVGVYTVLNRVQLTFTLDVLDSGTDANWGLHILDYLVK
jgi:hypothetical protein